MEKKNVLIYCSAFRCHQPSLNQKSPILVILVPTCLPFPFCLVYLMQLQVCLRFSKVKDVLVSFCFYFCFSLSTPSHWILPLTVHLVCCLLLLFTINTFLLLCVGVPWPSCSTGFFCLLSFSTILSVGEQFMTNSQPGL